LTPIELRNNFSSIQNSRAAEETLIAAKVSWS
jgi:hypothetical protein